MSTPEKVLWKRAREVLEQVIELPQAKRAGRLNELAQGDGDLVAEVEALLACETDLSFLDLPNTTAWAPHGQGDPPISWTGQRLGPYAIERELGSGGMGTVFLAERADGAFEQRVAIKIIKRGMDSDAILERFRRERQVLASLEHPGIARLIDGSANSAGQPYLVMEFVEGQPIDRYCAELELDLRGRIQLFLEVCAAVQHAHENLVVHRDIKPANILVTRSGAPKLLDFGLATLLTPDGSARSYELTAEGERLLTPVYAAPEQVRGEAITTVTDVYALGVLLYELLCGVRPYELAGLPWSEVEELVCRVDPPAPSVARRRASPRTSTRVTRALDGDLDVICLTALRKEPGQRYRSVDRLASDLERYLGGLPIAARPPTLRYRTTKFVRRNRVLTGSIATLLVVLLVSIAVVSRQERITRDALHETRAALDNAAAVNGFMRGVILAADPRDQGVHVTVRDAVELAAQRSLTDLNGLPEADVRAAIGTAYRTFGNARGAREHLEIASAIQARELGAEHLNTLHTMHELALAQRELDLFDDAEATIAAVVAGRTKRLGPSDAETIQSRELQAVIALDKGDFERAHELLEDVCSDFAEVLGPGHAVTLVAMKHLANTLRYLGRPAEAAELLAEILTQQERALGAEDIDTLITRVDLAAALRQAGRSGEAEAHYVAASKGFEAQLPPEHLTRAITSANLASYYSDLGRFDEALELGEPLLEVCREHLGDDHALTGKVRSDLARALSGLGLEQAAQSLLDE